MLNSAPTSPAWWRLGLYASGNGAKNIVWNATELALLFIFTDLFGVPPGVAGALILASLLWDAAIDPVIGAAADRIGGFWLLIVAGAPALAVSFVLLLGGPALGLHGALFAALCLFAVRTAYSAVDIPHNALLSRLATTEYARNRLAGVRFMFSAAATLVLGLVLPEILANPSAPTAEKELLIFAVTAGLAATTILIGSALAARPFDRCQATKQASTAPLIARSFAPLRDSNVRRVLALVLISATATPLFAKSALYFAEYVLQDATLARGATVAIGLGHFVGAPLWIFAARRFGAEKAFLVAHVIAGLFSLPLYAGGALSEAGFAVVAAAHAIGSSGVFILIWPLTAATADDRTQNQGTSATGAVFGLAIMATQVGAGLGSALLGAGLSSVGFQTGVAAGPQVQFAITAMAALGPTLGAAAAIGVAILARHPRRSR